MEDKLYFNGFTTSLKSMENVKSEERYFEGLLTVQMKDKQGEITIVDELYKVLPVWMDRGAPISDTHSNRIVGKGINYSRTVVKNESGEELPAIKITGKIFKNYELDNVIWDKIKAGEYKGLSFGGATRTNRTPIVMKDGSIAYALKDLEHYEVAVCKDPAVPMALITDFNPIAKAHHSATDRGDGKMVIQCTKMGCYVDKAEIPQDQIQMGTKVEMEHTDDEGEARKIAMDHLKEDPHYYTKLGEAMPKEKKIMETAKAEKPEGVELNKPMREEGGEKKFKVYVKDPQTGNIKIVRFGDPNMEIKRDDPERRESFRARHDCENAKDITTPQYWSCKMWEKETSVTEYTQKDIEGIIKADLGKYDTFEEKVQALMREGYPRENAENIVGAFVKGEKKKETGAMSTSDSGVVNNVYNDKDKEKEMANIDNKTTNMYNQDTPQKYSTKSDTTVNQDGGVRNVFEKGIKQSGMEEEETNEIKRAVIDEINNIHDVLKSIDVHKGENNYELKKYRQGFYNTREVFTGGSVPIERKKWKRSKQSIQRGLDTKQNNIRAEHEENFRGFMDRVNQDDKTEQAINQKAENIRRIKRQQEEAAKRVKLRQENADLDKRIEAMNLSKKAMILEITNIHDVLKTLPMSQDKINASVRQQGISPYIAGKRLANMNSFSRGAADLKHDQNVADNPRKTTPKTNENFEGLDSPLSKAQPKHIYYPETRDWNTSTGKMPKELEIHGGIHNLREGEHYVTGHRPKALPAPPPTKKEIKNQKNREKRQENWPTNSQGVKYPPRSKIGKRILAMQNQQADSGAGLSIKDRLNRDKLDKT